MSHSTVVLGLLVLLFESSYSPQAAIPSGSDARVRRAVTSRPNPQLYFQTKEWQAEFNVRLADVRQV
jgi:hypothetical protein